MLIFKKRSSADHGNLRNHEIRNAIEGSVGYIHIVGKTAYQDHCYSVARNEHDDERVSTPGNHHVEVSQTC